MEEDQQHTFLDSMALLGQDQFFQENLRKNTEESIIRTGAVMKQNKEEIEQKMIKNQVKFKEIELNLDQKRKRKMEIEHEKKVIEDTVKAMKQRLEEVKQKKDQEEKILEDYIQKLDSLEVIVRALNNDLQELEADLMQLETSKLSMDQMTQNLTQMETKSLQDAAYVEEEAEKKEIEIERLQEVLQDLSHHIETTKSELKQQEKQLNKLQKNLRNEENKKAKEESQKKQAETTKSSLERQLATTNQELEGYTSQIATLDNEILALQETLAQTSDVEEEVSGRCGKKSLRTVSRANERQAIQNKIMQKQFEKSSIENRRNTASIKRDTLEQNIATQEATISTLDSKVLSRDRAITSLINEKQQCEETIRAKHHDLAKFQSESAHTKSTLFNEKGQLRIFQTKGKNIQAELDRIKSNLNRTDEEKRKIIDNKNLKKEEIQRVSIARADLVTKIHNQEKNVEKTNQTVRTFIDQLERAGNSLRSLETQLENNVASIAVLEQERPLEIIHQQEQSKTWKNYDNHYKEANTAYYGLQTENMERYYQGQLQPTTIPDALGQVLNRSKREEKTVDNPMIHYNTNK